MASSEERDGTGKHLECTNRVIIEQIRTLAANPSSVLFSRTSQRSMDKLSLTRTGVLYAICDYIDNGGLVDITITDTNTAHIGNPMYVMYPTIDYLDIYVKVRIDQHTDCLLIIISVHE